MNDSQGKFERIAESVEAWRGELGVPGATFGLTIGGESYTGGVGVTHAAHPLPVTDETIFQIGSITKDGHGDGDDAIGRAGRAGSTCAGSRLLAGLPRAGRGRIEAGHDLAFADA